MIYAVNRYYDQLTVAKEIEFVPDYDGKKLERHHYFETEKEAKQFIINRANGIVVAAERNLQNAMARQRKCAKKYCWTLKDGAK